MLIQTSLGRVLHTGIVIKLVHFRLWNFYFSELFFIVMKQAIVKVCLAFRLNLVLSCNKTCFNLGVNSQENKNVSTHLIG